MKRPLEGEGLGPRKQQDGKFTRNRECTTVLVSNLPKSCNQSKIRTYFQECGRIAQIDVCESFTGKTRLARVEFTNYNEVLSALTKTFKKLGNNEIKVDHLVDCTLWMTNFPPEFTSRDIKELLKSINILTLSVRLPSLRFNANRRFAYVDLTSQCDVEKAVTQLNGISVRSYCLVVKRSNLLAKSKRTDAGIGEKREIMVRHLNLEKISQINLKEFFSAYGYIESLRIPITQEDGLNDGYAFITFQEKSAADKALKANHTLFEDRTITVQLADRKEYLERQKVKRILSSRSQNDAIISLFPLSDKISKVQLESMLTEKSILEKHDIKNIYLVTDHEGALITLSESKLAAKCIMSLNGSEFKGKMLRCGTVKDLRQHSQDDKRAITPDPVNERAKHSIRTEALNENESSRQLSNEDFRKLFLGK